MTPARFADLRTPEDLARATGASVQQIQDYAADPKQAAGHYSVLRLKKRGKGRKDQFRVVFRPRTGWLDGFHHMVALMVIQAIPLGAHVQGFVQKRSIVTNARQHLGAAKLLHADIANFFDSVTTSQVADGFATLGAPAQLASLLARACTIDGALRQGTRCAPALANLVCRGLDNDLLALAQVHQATYTRYADDIVFSGDRVPAGDVVARLLEQHGFRLRADGCRTQTRGNSQFVTGLYVGDPTQPRLQRRLKKRLRLVLHYIEKYGMDGHFAHKVEAPRDPEDLKGLKGQGLRFRDPLELAGLLRYAQSVEPALVNKLRKQFQAGSAKSRAEAPSHEDYMYDPNVDPASVDPEPPAEPSPPPSPSAG